MPLLVNPTTIRSPLSTICLAEKYKDKLYNVCYALSCELKYENKTYIITNVYCSNDSGVRKTFIRDIDPYVTDGSLTEKLHILTGDFNCVLDKEIDRVIMMIRGEKNLRLL